MRRALDAWGEADDARRRWGTFALAVVVGLLVASSPRFWAANLPGAPTGRFAAAVVGYLVAVAMCASAGRLSARVVGRRGDRSTLAAALGSVALTYLSLPVVGISRSLVG